MFKFKRYIMISLIIYLFFSFQNNTIDFNLSFIKITLLVIISIILLVHIGIKIFSIKDKE